MWSILNSDCDNLIEKKFQRARYGYLYLYLNRPIYASITGGDLVGKELLRSLGNDSDYEKRVTLDELDDAITRVWAGGPIEIE